MIGVITGDIINSRNLETPGSWMIGLKEVFNNIGPAPGVWDIYRGDSFQLELTNPGQVFMTILHIKATVKSIKGIDVRMAIGIGEKKYAAERITEANGEAFIYSGEQFEKLKKEKLTLAIRSPWPEWDVEMNLYFKLASIVMDLWKPKTAELVKAVLNHPDKSQQEIADLLSIQQAAVSQGLKRAHLNELLELEHLVSIKVNSLTETYDHPH